MNRSEIVIADRPVGRGRPTFVIAEIGVNHDGSVRRAMELVELAAAGGADAVKLQLFTADRLLHGSSAFADYQKTRVDDVDPAAMLRRFELSPAEAAMVVGHIRRHKLVPLATPFSPADVHVIRSLDLPAVKIASPDLVNLPLLDSARETGRPILASTGAATMDEVATTVGWLGDYEPGAALLHCVSSYPVPNGCANLCWIEELSRFGLPVGYSDHTTDELAGAAAVAGGACVVEKHLTYDRNAAGPDHSASADAQQFAAYVKMIRRVESLRGSPGKRVLEIEQDVRQVSRQSLVLVRDLAAGDVIGNADVTVQRPGTGISAADIRSAVGRRVSTAVRRGTLLRWEMIADAA